MVQNYYFYNVLMEEELSQKFILFHMIVFNTVINNHFKKKLILIVF